MIKPAVPATARLADVFAAVDDLSDAGRAVLRAGLVAAGHLAGPDVALGEVALVGLQRDDVRRRLRLDVEQALVAGWDYDRWSSRTLGELAPVRHPGTADVMSPGCCSARLHGALDRAGFCRWSALTALTVSELLSLTNLGPKALAEVVAMCVERSLAGVAMAQGAPGTTDLGALLQFEHSGGNQPVVEALLDHWAGNGGEPGIVREAATRLLTANVPWAVDTAGALEGILGLITADRDRAVFLAGSLQTERLSLAKLAAEFGVSSTRIGQVRDRAEATVRAAMAESSAPLPWLVRSVRARLGSLTTTEDAAAVLAAHGVSPDASPHPVAELLAWLAGPYLGVPHRPGWIATDPRAVTTRTASLLATDGGVRRLGDVEAELADVGVARHQVGPWLHACGAAIVDEMVVSLQGSPADACERVLDASGRALTVDELAAVIDGAGRHVPADGVAHAVRGRRFRRSGDGVGLAAWAVATGRVAPGPDDVEEGLWLWVRVDAAVLAGESACVPVALVTRLGLARPRRRTFASRYGPVTLAHDDVEPTRGSVRAIALAAGAAVDDTLLLGFSATGSVAVEVRRAPCSPVGPTQLSMVPPEACEGER